MGCKGYMSHMSANPTLCEYHKTWFSEYPKAEVLEQKAEDVDFWWNRKYGEPRQKQLVKWSFSTQEFEPDSPGLQFRIGKSKPHCVDCRQIRDYCSKEAKTAHLATTPKESETKDQDATSNESGPKDQEAISSRAWLHEDYSNTFLLY